MNEVPLRDTVIEPRFAARIAEQCFGVSGVATPLSGERDDNFRVETGDGERFVLKVAPVAEDRAALEAEVAAMHAVRREVSDLAVPYAVPAVSGESVTQVETGTGVRLVRLHSYLPGRVMAEVAPYSESLLRSVGRAIASLDNALAGVTAPVRSADFPWDLTRAPAWIRMHRDAVAGDERRKLLDRSASRVEMASPQQLAPLARSAIHNDGNERNIIVGDDGERVTGILDFGDMLEGPRVVDLAVAAAYASLGAASPLRAAASVVAGYHDVLALAEDEVEVLYGLLVARLCLSVAVSASRRARFAANPYLGISEDAAWSGLERWDAIHPRLAEATFRAACGLGPHARHRRVTQWLERRGSEAAAVVEPDPSSADSLVLDLSSGSADPCAAVSPSDPRFVDVVADRMRREGLPLALGRYLEPRRVYTAPQFNVAGGEVEDVRTIHLGIDVFAAAGTPVLAPFDGVVHSVADNDRPLDYGPTLILHHETDDGDEFGTLYGHLSRRSLTDLTPGQTVRRGQRLAELGEPTENGGWPPHLHFQVIVDLLETRGDFPGVCAPWWSDVWRTLCPNPNLLMRIRTLSPAVRDDASSMVERRRARLGPSLSVAYRSPLTIVRGDGPYLIDHLGRRYLDGVNNVCHVGHCHPAVVAAIARQAALLNTNTRYLHDRILEYAERLAETLPSPLEVCFLTNSGSEANELALRMARAHTNGSAVIVVDGAYHGNTAALVDVSPYKFAGPGGGGRPAHVQVVPTPDEYRGPYRNDPDPAARYAEAVDRAIDAIQRAHGRLAAFMVEPIMSCAGQIPLVPAFLPAAFTQVREAGGVCIADEVQTGFGRVGRHFWAFQLHGVTPDIVTMGKPIGNGHPLGAVVTTRAIAQSFANGMEYFNTFGGNPVACAAGLAVLDVLESERLQERALRLGSALMDGLRELARDNEAVGDVRGSGLFLGLELVRDREARSPSAGQASYLVERMKQRGILLSTDGPDQNVIKIKPPMVWKADHVQQVLSAVNSVMTEPAFRSRGTEAQRHR